MSELPHDAEDLSRIYASRFEGQERYRLAVWRILIETVFASWIRSDQTVLDLGAGQGEFINQIRAARKCAIDLNPESRRSLDPAVEFFEQDCSAPWPIGEASLDLVFTSNFLALRGFPWHAAADSWRADDWVECRNGYTSIALRPFAWPR